MQKYQFLVSRKCFASGTLLYSEVILTSIGVTEHLDSYENAGRMF